MTDIAMAEPKVGVRFGVLGPLLVVDGGGARAVSAAKQRIVLATLLLAAGGTVSAAALAEALWDESPPPNAATAMRTYVMRLRRALGSAGARITGDPSGWAVELVSPDELDLAEVDGLWRAARAAAGAQDWWRASSLLARALGLWRGEPLADVPSAALARREAGRLAELRLQLTEARVDVDLCLGRHGELVAELRRLAAEHPLREHIFAQLMLACYQCGQQAAALEVYRDARATLARELGVEPGYELRELHQKILAADPDLTVGAAAVRAGLPQFTAEPTHEMDDEDGMAVSLAPARPTRPGQGKPPITNGEVELEDLGSAGDGGAPRGLPLGHLASGAVFRPVCQLLSDLPDFTGRFAECDRLAELLVPAEGAVAVPVVVVSGPPGAGKTSVALHVAHALREHFPDGQLFVQLAGASPSARAPGEVLGELLRALGMAAGSIPVQAQARSAVFRSWLADRRVLLIADDAASADQVRMLIPGTAGCAVLITSRDQLAGLTAAHVYLDSLQPDEALQMLGRIAGQQRVIADPAAAAGLVAACGHLPLAVRIVGARLAARPSWPVAMIAALVSGERHRLDELTVGDLGVRAALEPSYQALPSCARTAFRLLALAGPFDFAAWVPAVLVGSDDAAEVVNLLADKSMLSPREVDATGQPRYRLHDLLRDYAGEQLSSEQHERAAAIERLLRAWLQLSRRAGRAMPPDPYRPPIPGGRDRPVLPQEIAADLTADPVAWFSAERLNLRHATALACDRGNPELALQLASNQAAFHHSQARFDEAEQLWRMVNTAARRVSDKLVATHATFGFAVTRALKGYHAEVSPVIGECAAAFDELGDQHALAYALQWQSLCAVMTGDRVQALQYSQQGLNLARRNRDTVAEIILLRESAFALAGIGGCEDEAIRIAQSSLSLARQAGEQTHELDNLQTLAHVNNLAGRYSTAEHLARQGIDLAEERHCLADLAYFGGSLGDACYGLGKYQDAINVYARALPVFREHGLRRHEALCLLKMAESHLALGNTTQARAYLDQCEAAFTELQLSAYVKRTRESIRKCSLDKSR
jgi:DNA-binding SARP family transcriptional activator/TolA-binding protein